MELTVSQVCFRARTNDCKPTSARKTQQMLQTFYWEVQGHLLYCF